MMSSCEYVMDRLEAVDTLWICSEIFSHGEMTFFDVRVDKFGRRLTNFLPKSHNVGNSVVLMHKTSWHADCSSIGASRHCLSTN